jgi:hydroxymethylglutaryl-CoA reductase (NADPH)
MSPKIPRSSDKDYTREMAETRRKFLKEQTGVELENVGQYSFDPAMLPGNIEHFIGVAQVPIGLAGPLRSMANTRRASSISLSRRRKARS